jgi:hypothetical protein
MMRNFLPFFFDKFYLNLFNNVWIWCCSCWLNKIQLNLFTQLLIDFFHEQTLLNKAKQKSNYYMVSICMLSYLSLNTILLLSLSQMSSHTYIRWWWWFCCCWCCFFLGYVVFFFLLLFPLFFTLLLIFFSSLLFRFYSMYVCVLFFGRPHKRTPQSNVSHDICHSTNEPSKK